MTPERRALVDALNSSRPDSREELAASQALDKYDREHPLPRWRPRSNSSEIPNSSPPKRKH